MPQYEEFRRNQAFLGLACRSLDSCAAPYNKNDILSYSDSVKCQLNNLLTSDGRDILSLEDALSGWYWAIWLIHLLPWSFPQGWVNELVSVVAQYRKYQGDQACFFGLTMHESRFVKYPDDIIWTWNNPSKACPECLLIRFSPGPWGFYQGNIYFPGLSSLGTWVSLKCRVLNGPKAYLDLFVAPLYKNN